MNSTITKIVLPLLASLFACSTAIAAAGKVIMATGDCKINGSAAGRGATINNGDTITTGADGKLQYRGIDNALTQVNPNSTLKVTLTPNGDGAENKLAKGALIAISGKSKAPASTKTTKLAVQGTTYSLIAGQYGNGASIWEGKGEIETDRGEYRDIGPESGSNIIGVTNAICQDSSQKLVTSAQEAENLEEAMDDPEGFDENADIAQDEDFESDVESVEDEVGESEDENAEENFSQNAADEANEDEEEEGL